MIDWETISGHQERKHTLGSQAIDEREEIQKRKWLQGFRARSNWDKINFTFVSLQSRQNFHDSIASGEECSIGEIYM